MEQHLGRIVELYECRNMVKYLKGKYNYDNKAPIEISTFLDTSRVIMSLVNKYTAFTKNNLNASVYQLTGRANLFDLVKIVDVISSKHSEDDNFNMTQQQKEKLNELVEGIEKGILHMAGFIIFEYEANDIPVQLEPEQMIFVEEAKRAFALHVKANESVLGGDDIGDEVVVDGNGNVIVDDDEDVVILGASKKDKKQVTTEEVKPTISTDVDRV